MLDETNNPDENTAGLKTLMLQYGTDRSGRVDGDFYETPDHAVRALLERESFVGGPVWEPACGAGAIVGVLETAGLSVLSTDLYDRGCGERLDFLDLSAAAEVAERSRPMHVITNPPYKHALDFVKNSRKLVPGKVAMFLRLQFLEGVTRKAELYDVDPPARIYVFSYRVGCTKAGVAHKGGMVPHCWIVFDGDARQHGTHTYWI